MRKCFFIICLLFISSICFAADYYAEYSFAELDNIDASEIHGVNGEEYSFVTRMTKTDIQDLIDGKGVLYNNDSKKTAANYMKLMLRASTDKRIFVIDTSVQYEPWGWLFIKINENEYIVFYTGQ